MKQNLCDWPQGGAIPWITGGNGDKNQESQM